VQAAQPGHARVRDAVNHFACRPCCSVATDSPRVVRVVPRLPTSRVVRGNRFPCRPCCSVATDSARVVRVAPRLPASRVVRVFRGYRPPCRPCCSAATDLRGVRVVPWLPTSVSSVLFRGYRPPCCPCCSAATDPCSGAIPSARGPRPTAVMRPTAAMPGSRRRPAFACGHGRGAMRRSLDRSRPAVPAPASARS
jgi:hypothetical protein